MSIVLAAFLILAVAIMLAIGAVVPDEYSIVPIFIVFWLIAGALIVVVKRWLFPDWQRLQHRKPHKF